MTDDHPAQSPASEVAIRKDLYATIGEFIYTFSNLEFNVRNLLGTILDLKEEDQFYAVTSPYDFAALCNVTRTLLQGLPESDLSDKSGVEKIFKRCFAVNEERVRIVHATWILQAGAHYVSRRTLEPKMYFESKDEIEKHTAECDLLWGEIDKLVMIITANRLDD